jgi:hypothetical protein
MRIKEPAGAKMHSGRELPDEQTPALVVAI